MIQNLGATVTATSAAVAVITTHGPRLNQDPPPFWPDFSLGAQTGDSRVKFDPAP